MAEVYLAEQLQLKRWVAVKILKPELADDATYLQRFEREAQAAASLVHANIVQIHDVGRADGLHYIVQEYVQGQNLRDWLARNGPPLLQPALSIMRQIAAALAKAAEQGVIHRDIKPENIMITAAGEVKVADFGLARVLSDTDSAATALTQVGITMGTPLYMSPEQVEGRPLDHRSDLYSFGVLCYHMLTGKPPFTGETALAVAVQHVKKPPAALEMLRPDLPPALCRVVHQMLAKDPEQRWRSCGELLRELYRIQVEYCPQASPEELAAWSTAGIEPLSEPRMQAARQLAEAMRTTRAARHVAAPWLVAAAVLAMCTLGGVTAWCTMRPANLAPSPAGETAVPQQGNELRQWFFASRIGTEEAWKKVVDFPGVSDLTKLLRGAAARANLPRQKELRRRLENLQGPGCDEGQSRDQGLRAGGDVRHAVATAEVPGIGGRREPALGLSQVPGPRDEAARPPRDRFRPQPPRPRDRQAVRRQAQRHVQGRGLGTWGRFPTCQLNGRLAICPSPRLALFQRSRLTGVASIG